MMATGLEAPKAPSLEAPNDAAGLNTAQSGPSVTAPQISNEGCIVAW